MSSSLPERPKRRRWWKWTRRILFGLVGLIVVAVAAVLVIREVKKARAEKELAAAIAELDRTDPRWRLEQIEEDRPDVPAEENSVRVAHEVFESLGGWNPGSLKIPDQHSTPPWPANQQLTPDHLDGIRNALRDREQTIARSATLIRFPKGCAKAKWSETDPFTTPLPHLEESRKVVALLDLDIERILHQKGTQQALDRVRAIVNLSQGLQGEPSLLGILVQVAIRSVAVRKLERALAMTEVPDKNLREMQRALQVIADSVSFSTALRGERAIAHRVFENLASGRLTLEQLASGPGKHYVAPDLEGRLLFFMYMASLKADHALYLRTMTRAIDWTGLPLSVQKVKWQELDDELKTIPFLDLFESGKLLTRLIFPAIQMIFKAYQRDRALIPCAIVLIASERYRLARGKWPENLAELCPEFLPMIPNDPYDDQPIKYQKGTDFVTIYCIGPDGVDNGGENLNLRETVSDLGLRLWNRDKRGIPPPKDDDPDDLPKDER
jgi:hypothetical protein